MILCLFSYSLLGSESAQDGDLCRMASILRFATIKTIFQMDIGRYENFSGILDFAASLFHQLSQNLDEHSRASNYN